MPHYCKDVTKENDLKTKALSFYSEYFKITTFLLFPSLPKDPLGDQSTE